MSAWIDIDKAVDDKYVFSYKPNPAFLAEDKWRPELVKQKLQEVLEKTKGCHVEIIIKDISTVRYQPQRLWELHGICMELRGRYVGTVRQPMLPVTPEVDEKLVKIVAELFPET